MPLADASLFRQQGFIDGKWCDADASTTLTVDDPATGLNIGSIPDMGAAETLTGSFLLDEHLVAEAAARDIQTLNLGRAIADGRREVKITARDLE